VRQSEAVAQVLPEFSVRRSARARRVRLTVTAREGLVVVVPERWRGDVAELVASKAVWAEQALASVADKRALHSAGAEALLPHQIELRARGALLPVEYRAGTGTRVSARTIRGAVAVSGDIDDADACLAALRRWLSREAAAWLPARCEVLGAETGLRPRKVRVTGARTRWGSCSAAGTVMLNRRLMFLPPELVDALILHELAHLSVLDHSARFWTLLTSLDADAAAHRKRLRNAADLVPAWADD
jgi:predicted metal-dependent hydrolase